MKDKLFFVLLTIVVFFAMTAFLMPALAIELPEALVAVISAGIAFLVTQFLKWVGGLVGVDISGWGSFITAALVTIVVGIVNNLLGYVPLEFESVVQVIFQLLIVLLGAMGIHGFYKLSKK